MTVELTLIDYQDTAAREVLRRLNRAARDFDEEGDHAAVVLIAPTGSGKTVIATAVLETLLEGGDMGEPRDGLTVLWVTDDPSLNEQTRRKIALASDASLPMEVIRTSSNFDQETLDRGKIYFLNIQSLGKATSLVKDGNGRRYSLWDTIDNTIRQRGSDFLVIVDEAHRGAQPDKNTSSIVQRIIGGDYPVPVVLGISATATKFLTSVDAGQVGHRDSKTVGVPIEEVQKSGLVKDRIVLYSPDDDNHEVNADTTLIRHAVRRLREYEQRWDVYTAAQNEAPVSPALVIQVGDKPSTAELRDIHDAVIAEWPGITAENFVNTFSEHAAVDLGGGASVEYMRPHLIQDTPDVRVILAKNAITTGWDCPRAEVLVSLRTAKDATYIAQLIGRIVRQPLARRIDSDEMLNQVFAVLPNFDDDEVEKVAALFDASKETATGSEVVRATIPSRPTPGADAAIESLVELPSYLIPGQVKVSQVKRLHGLAAELSADGLLPGAGATADLMLHAELDKQATILGDVLTKRKERVAQVKISSSVFDITGKLLERVDHGTDVMDANNVGDLFKIADRQLKDGLGRSYWDYLTTDDDDALDTQITVAALGTLPETADAADTAAGNQVAAWLKQFGKAISTLPDARRAVYDRIRGEAQSPELRTVNAPKLEEDAVPVLVGEDSDAAVRRVLADTANRWERHLVTSETDDRYWAAFSSSWETKVVRTELDGGAVWWYRNPQSGSKSLTIPYEDGGRTRGLHPDFIFWHDVAGELVPSIVDPHGQNQRDSEPKLRGLIAYAAEHGTSYRAINPVIVIGTTYWALALQHPNVRSSVNAALDAGTPLETIYEELGVVYA